MGGKRVRTVASKRSTPSGESLILASGEALGLPAGGPTAAGRVREREGRQIGSTTEVAHWVLAGLVSTAAPRRLTGCWGRACISWRGRGVMVCAPGGGQGGCAVWGRRRWSEEDAGWASRQSVRRHHRCRFFVSDLSLARCAERSSRGLMRTAVCVLQAGGFQLGANTDRPCS